MNLTPEQRRSLAAAGRLGGGAAMADLYMQWTGLSRGSEWDTVRAAYVSIANDSMRDDGPDDMFEMRMVSYTQLTCAAPGYNAKLTM